MKTRNLVALAASITALAVPATAAAQDAHGFGSQTQLIISADRLVPLFAWTSNTVTVENGPNTVEVTQSDTSTSLLWGGDGPSWGIDGQTVLGVRSPHTVPRAAIDFVVIPHLTIGGSFAFAFNLGGSIEGETRTNNTTQTTRVDSPSHTVIAFGPRVGYIIPLGDILAFWPRGGFSFYSIRRTEEDNDNDRDTLKATAFSLDVEGQLVIVPIEHFFFNVGPIFNVPLTGTLTSEEIRGNRTTSRDFDLTLWHFGITAGLGGWFNL